MSCPGGCGGTSVSYVARGVNRSVFRYDNEGNCGITIDRLRLIDINVTSEYKKTKNPYLLTVNTDLRKMINGFNRIDICEQKQQIEDWEVTYGG